MTTAVEDRMFGGPDLLDRRPRTRPPSTATLPGLAEDARGRTTLEDLISGAWDGLSSSAAVACPVCRGTLDTRYGIGPGAVAGSCRTCGSTLS